MNKSSKFHRLMQVLAMFLCVAMVAGTVGTANAAGGNAEQKEPKSIIITKALENIYWVDDGKTSKEVEFDLKFKVTNTTSKARQIKVITTWEELDVAKEGATFQNTKLQTGENPRTQTTDRAIAPGATTSEFDVPLGVISDKGLTESKQGMLYRVKIQAYTIEESYNDWGWLVKKDVLLEEYTTTPNVQLFYSSVVTTVVNGVETKQEVPYGKTIAAPEAPEGQQFDGWYTAKVGGQKVEGVTAPQKLYAHFSAKPVEKHNVTFTHTYGGSMHHGIGDNTVKVDDGKTVAKPADPICTSVAERERHKFVGWYTDDTFETEFDFNQPIKGNTKIYGWWSYQTNLEIKPNQGNNLKFDDTSVKSVQVNYGRTVLSVLPNLNSVTVGNKEYKITGWQTRTSNHHGGYNYSNIDINTYKVTANTTLYAVVEKIQKYDVTYFDGSNQLYQHSVEAGQVYSILEEYANLTSTDSHKTFLGWYTNPACTEEYKATAITENLNLYAGWKTEYKVTFSAGNKTFTSAIDSLTVESGKSITLPTSVSETTGHYVFSGWLQNGTAVSGSSYQVKGDVEFVANWNAKINPSSASLIGSTKTTYNVGDTFEIGTLQIQIKDYDGVIKSTVNVTASMLTYDFSTAGNKTVAINYTDAENNQYAFGVDVTVNRLSGVISITDESIEATYGDVITILGTGSTNTPVIKSNDTDIVVVNSDNTLTIVGVGETSITISVAQTDKYEAAEVTIPVIASAKPVTISWDEETLVLTYNGKEQAPKAFIDGILTGDTCNVKVDGAQKNVKNDYVATAIIDNANYVISGDATTKFNIVPKVIEIVWSDTKLVYNAEDQAPTAEVAEGELCENDTCEVTVTGKQTEVGDDYTAYAFLSNENYALSADDSERDYVIAPKAIKLVWGNTEFVYNGEAQAPTVAVKDGELCGDDKVKVSLSGIGYFNVGIYTAEASIDNNNYVIADGFAKKDYTIAQAEIKEITIEIDKLICGTEISEKLPMVIAEDIDLTEGQSIQVIGRERLRAISFDGVGGRLIAEPIETNRVSFGQDWNKVKLTVSDNVDYPAHFAILGDPLPNGLDGFTYFTGTVRGGKEYKAEFSMLLAGNYTVGENTKIVLKYGDEVLKADSIKVNPAIGTLNSLDITMSLLAEHVPGEAEKDEDSVVEPTFEADGSYDMVVKCTKCGEVLSRKPFSIAKLIPEVESITFSGFDKVKKAYLVGDELDVTGLQYTVKMTDGTSETKDVTKDMVTGFSSAVENNALVLSLTYGGEAASYTVSVAEPAGEYVVEGDTKFNGKDNMKLHIIHTNAKRNAGLFAQFGGLDMDGKVVAKANYDATNGSIKLDIHSDYLKTLSEGEHNLTVEIGEDKVDVKITITKVQEEVTEPTQPAQQAATSDNAPSTGDTGSLVLWYVIALIALLSAAALAVARQKSRREEF